LNELNEIYNTLRDLTSKKPSPGNDKVNNIEAAKEQERQVRDWIRQAGIISSRLRRFPTGDQRPFRARSVAAALRRTIDQLQHEADTASVPCRPIQFFL
jgi:hypothetical protein